MLSMLRSYAPGPGPGSVGKGGRRLSAEEKELVRRIEGVAQRRTGGACLDECLPGVWLASGLELAVGFCPIDST
eukprot:365714-Chlamydomonas_euryale.AAC.3